MLRIGINLGDVIIENDDLYGDGVNIAARLEPLAESGGIFVSSIVNESVGNRIDVSFRDSGEINVKNIERPIRIVDTWLFEGWPDAEAVETVELHETDGVTKVKMNLAFLDQAGRDHMSKTDGQEDSWDKMEDYLRTL